MILCLAIVSGIPAEIMVTENSKKAFEFEDRWLTEAGFLESTEEMSPNEKVAAVFKAKDQYRDVGHEDIDYYIYYNVKPDRIYY
jgi:hypothetical protein